MTDRSDDLEALTIELLYLARDCDDQEAGRKMRAAAELLTDAVKVLRRPDARSEDPGQSKNAASDALPFAVPRV